MNKWIIPLFLLILIAACIQPHIFGGKVPDVNTTEKVVYDGATPIKDKLDIIENSAVKSQNVATEIYKVVKDTKLPYTFNDGKTEITIKKIDLVTSDAKVGYWITTKRDEKEVLTHSPIWIVNSPTDIEVSSIYDDIKNEKTTTIKEDPLSAAQQVLAGYVSRQPLGKAEGDDVLIVYTSGTEDGDVYYSGTADTYTVYRNHAGSGIAATATTSRYGISSATGLTDKYTVFRRGYVEYNTSSLGSCTINSAIVGIYGHATTFYNLGGFNVTITGFTPATPGTVESADYNKFGNTLLSDTIIEYGSWSVSGYNNYTLNEGGLSNINKSGYSNFMLRTGDDFYNDTSRIVWASNTYNYVYFQTQEHGTTGIPFIQITYTPAAGGDTTPPASVTNLDASNTTCTELNLTYTKPADADFNHTMIYQDDVFHINESNNTNFHKFTGLTGGQSYTFSTKTVDITGNVNTTWVNVTQTAVACSDTTPPASITNLANTTTCHYINWTWTNPVDADFNHTYILKNDVFYHNLTNSTVYDNWTSLFSNKSYTFSLKTVDITGNMNATWVNQTNTTPEISFIVVRNGTSVDIIWTC